MFAAASTLNVWISIGAPIAALVGAYTAYRAYLARKEIDRWTLNLEANTKSVASLEAALTRADKDRALLESRFLAAESSATSLHISVTSLRGELEVERQMRERDQKVCSERLNALTLELQRLEGHQ